MNRKRPPSPSNRVEAVAYPNRSDVCTDHLRHLLRQKPEPITRQDLDPFVGPVRKSFGLSKQLRTVPSAGRAGQSSARRSFPHPATELTGVARPPCRRHPPVNLCMSSFCIHTSMDLWLEPATPSAFIALCKRGFAVFEVPRCTRAAMSFIEKGKSCFPTHPHRRPFCPGHSFAGASIHSRSSRAEKGRG